jgi:hypothetical protein
VGGPRAGCASGGEKSSPGKNTQIRWAGTKAETTTPGTSTGPSAPSSCHLVSVKSGSVSCRTALAVANAAIAGGKGGPNKTVAEQGFACDAFPYEVDCASQTASFSAAYGSTGEQAG